MKVNQSKKQDKQYQIPMVVTDEVIHDFGFKPEDVTIVAQLSRQKSKIFIMN